MRRERCGGCGSPDLNLFLDLGATPLADAFPASPDEHEDRYPLQVAVCSSCWLVQLMEIVPDEVLFGDDYGFFSGASPSSVAYFSSYADDLLARFGEQARRLTVEIACNDGEMLQHFKAAGCRVLGLDPARPAARYAQQHRGLNVWDEPFDRKLVAEILDDYGPAGLVIANNVAAHVADLSQFFGGIADLLAGDGVAVVEVQNVADLLLGNQFDHVYHEHRYFFSLASLATTAGRHGLVVDRVWRTQAQGGSLRVVLRRGAPRGERVAWWLRDPATYESMQGRVGHLIDRLNDLFMAEDQAGRVMAGYGASAKSTTLLHLLDASPDMLPYVVDTTPAKIGRVTPGTHIPIISPEQEAERGRAGTYLLLVRNYLPGVLRREREFIDGGGRFIVPIPVPVIL